MERAFDKVRQAWRGMPAVMIRQLDALAKVAQFVTDCDGRPALVEQAGMILESSEESVPAAPDRKDVPRRDGALVGTMALGAEAAIRVADH